MPDPIPNPLHDPVPVTVNLPDDVDTLKAMIVARDAHIAAIEILVKAFRQVLFGRRSEKTDPDQFELALEDIETAIAKLNAEGEDNALVRPAGKSTPRKTNRGSLPKHLPRIEEIIEPEEMLCDCGTQRHVIGEDVSERLDVIPAQFRVIVTRRPKYADHLPLYRQAQIYSRQGIDLDRSTLAAWVGKAAFELRPVYDALIANLKRSTKLFMPSRQIALQSPAG